jgi:hypothetical protein
MTDDAGRENPHEPLEQSRAFGGVIDVLEAIGATYAIWGGLAVIAYGEPRFTMDMDVLLAPQGLAVDLFLRRLQESHYHVDPSAVQRALVEGGTFNVIHLDTHIKTDFYLPRGEDEHASRLLRERVILPFDELRQASYVTAEGAIASKLHAFAESGSTRHLEDIGSIVRVQGDELDGAAIDLVAARLGVLGAWRAQWDQNRPASA